MYPWPSPRRMSGFPKQRTRTAHHRNGGSRSRKSSAGGWHFCPGPYPVTDRDADWPLTPTFEMGRRKKLTEIDRLEGNPSRRSIEETGIDALGAPFVPEHLSDRGCIDIVKQSMPTTVYSALDSFLLAAFATAWAIHKRAAQEVSAPGFQFMTESKRGGPQASPWIRIVNQQAGILAALGDRLGLDPKSRAALKLPAAICGIDRRGSAGILLQELIYIEADVNCDLGCTGAERGESREKRKSLLGYPHGFLASDLWS